jgi:dipeptidyl aminopeptidase/acylaminoacyl peptidase
VSPESIHVGGYIDPGFAWAPDSAGFVVMAGPSSRANDRIHSEAFRLTLDGEMTSLGKLEGVTASPRYSPDGSMLAFIGVEDEIPARFVLLTMPGTGGTPNVVVPGFDGSFMEFAWLPDSRHILAGAETGQRATFVRVNIENGDVERAFTPSGPPGTTSGFSLAADGRRCALTWENEASYGDVHVVELGSESKQLTDLNPWIREYEFGELREISWISFDEMTIEGLLILPVGYEEGTRCPLMTHIHGGPAAAWTHHLYANWHDWGQFLAQRGYAVFLPNPRGSTGRSVDFLRGITGSYGETDLQDILSGVDALIERGIADPDRLVVGGWSGGGYLTNQVITSTGRFKAAVSGAGMSNVISYLGTADIRDVFTRYFGDIAENPETAWRLAPVRSVQRATTPTLILFGARDPRVPPNQGYELYAGLRSRGVEVQMVVYPREGHGIGERKHQLDVLRRVVEWYDRHLGRDGDNN